MARRLAPLLLLLAVALAGCAGDDPVAPPPAAAAAVKPKPVEIVPKQRFVRSVNAICRRMETPVRTIGAPPTMSADVAQNRRVVGDWFGRFHRVMRTARRRMARLGTPSHDRARWRRAYAKFHAVERHIDTMRAAAWSGSVDMLLLSVRQLGRSAESADRRLRRFGARDCAS
jgi:hypothetical protein